MDRLGHNLTSARELQASAARLMQVGWGYVAHYTEEELPLKEVGRQAKHSWTIGAETVAHGASQVQCPARRGEVEIGAESAEVEVRVQVASWVRCPADGAGVVVGAQAASLVRCPADGAGVGVGAQAAGWVRCPVGCIRRGGSPPVGRLVESARARL